MRQSFPGLPVFTKDTGEEMDDAEDASDDKSVEMMNIMKSIFLLVKKPPQSAMALPESVPVDENLAKQQTLVQYLKVFVT